MMAALEPIEDAPSPAMISRAVSNLTDANLGDFEHSDKGEQSDNVGVLSENNTPQHFLRNLVPASSEYGFESISRRNDSPSSAKSFEMSGQIDLQTLQYKVVNAAVPTHVPQPVRDLRTEWGEETATVGSEAGYTGASVANNTKTPISAVVVKVEGTTVSPQKEEAVLYAGTLESLDDTARSFGLDSLSGNCFD